MQPIEFADILSTDLQLAHTGYLTHALCLEGTATLLFNGASFPLQRGDCIIMQRSENAQITDMLRFGDFAWIARQNGNMTLKWIGAE